MFPRRMFKVFLPLIFSGRVCPQAPLPPGDLARALSGLRTRPAPGQEHRQEPVRGGRQLKVQVPRGDDQVRAHFYFPRQKKIGLSVNFPINSFSRNIDRSTLTEEQLRSLKYIHKVCKCKRNVRKHRCRKCEQCKAPKCGKCRNCLNPPLKQACSGKVCLFPIIPNCPCFR